MKQIIDFLLPYSDKLVVILITFFAPILPAMIAIGLLIIIDTITGIITSRRNRETITSKRLGGTITKLFLYELLIIASSLCETYLFPELMFVKITLAFISIVEFRSINENIQKTTGLPFLAYIKAYLDSKLRGLVKEGETDSPSHPNDKGEQTTDIIDIVS